MKANIWVAGLIAVVAGGSVSQAQGKRFVLMEGTGEFGWSINRPSKIDGEAEGRSLALAAVNAQVNGMANLAAFEQFSKSDIKNTLKNKYEEIGPYMANTTTFTQEKQKEEAFRGNLRGLVVTVEDRGFKPGTFTHSSDYNKWTGVRKSKASGIYLYTFRVYAPAGYNPNGGGQSGGGQKKEVRYTIQNSSGRTIHFQMHPSEKRYTLEAGRTFTGMSYEIDGKAPTMTVSDTGRTYKLTAGNHKFWWMAGENRVGFDLNAK